MPVIRATLGGHIRLMVTFLFDLAFLSEVERTLVQGGHLWLATDFGEYFDVMVDVLSQSHSMREVEAEWEGAKTNYEEKYLAEGKPIYRRVLEFISAEQKK